MRPVDRKRWRRSIVDHLDDMPRQLAALETSLEPFGDDFDLAAFSEAFDSQDPHRYNDVQAVERGFTRVQSYLARLADDGTKLANLERRPPQHREPQAQPWFEALRDEGVLSAELCRRLIHSQRDRNLLEHDYIRADAADVHASSNAPGTRARNDAPPFTSASPPGAVRSLPPGRPSTAARPTRVPAARRR